MTTMTTKADFSSPEIAKEVLNRITKFPETYNQHVWVDSPEIDATQDEFTLGGFIEDRHKITKWSDCGTTGCVAGHTAAVGVELSIEPNMFDPFAEYYDMGFEEVEMYAAYLLGLKRDLSSWLFSAKRSLQEVTACLERIVSGEL